MSDEPRFSASREYAFERLRRALDRAVAERDPGARERAEGKAAAWRAVLDGMATGRLTVGSRTPVEDTPAWVTLEVAHGGFATGRYLAEQPLTEYEITRLRTALGGMPDDVPSDVSGRTPGGRPGDAPGGMSGHVLGDVSSDVPGDALSGGPGDMSGHASGGVPGDLPGDAPSGVPGDMSGHALGGVPGGIAGDVSRDVPRDAPRDTPDDVPGGMPHEVSGGVSRDAPGDISGHVPGLALGETDRERLNLFYLSDTGQAELLAALASGGYRIDVPEEAALPVVAWLLDRGRHEAALDLVVRLRPWMARLKMTPRMAETAAPSGATVRLAAVGEIREALRSAEVNPEIAAMLETLRVWTPLYDRLVALWCDTVDGDLPRLSDIGVLEGGWPCRRWPADWASRRDEWLADYRQACERPTSATRHHHPRSNFHRLRRALEACEHDSGALSGRDVGWVRRALANTVSKHGAPGSERRAALRSTQAAVAARPTHAALAAVLAGRLDRYPADAGIPAIEPLAEETTHDELPDAAGDWTVRREVPGVAGDRVVRSEAPDAPGGQALHDEAADAAGGRAVHGEVPDAAGGGAIQGEAPNATEGRVLHGGVSGTAGGRAVRGEVPGAAGGRAIADAVSEAARGHAIPAHLLAKVARALEAPVDELVARGVITSGESLAEVLPQITAQVLAADFDDDRLAGLYAQTYGAFRRRRSLLLLNLEHQVRFDELPWVGALAPFRSPRPDAGRAARRALEETTLLALGAFPQAILPNPLLSELGALARRADLAMPLVEEVAADIFMGTFTDKWRIAADIAATLMAGTLYARYYDLPEAAAWSAEPGRHGWFIRRWGDQAALRKWGKRPAFVHRWGKPPAFTRRWGKRTAEDFERACVARAERAHGWGGGNDVAANGMVLEQSQILTTHNLAALVHALDLGSRLGDLAPDLAERTFAWIVARQAVRSPHHHAALQTIRNTAYAWRQAIFYLSFCDERRQRAAVDGLRRRAADAGLGDRLRPAVEGLAHVVDGGRFDPSGIVVDGSGLRFLGWTATGDHWCLPRT
ncbi:hypothetical protein [Nonomuraea antri]|uniref:hypothetical protein n=1 Tax=Nonomuraea antri TaxID=2730852 RepID=UPI001C2CA493|nr:hypothetical protein [Nonomuraea antri]